MAQYCYCSTCKQAQPFLTEEMRPETRYDEAGNWGDVRCLVCGRILLELKVNEPGQYAFRHIEALEQELDTPHVYCQTCEAPQPLGIAEMEPDTEFPEQGIWGDLVCLVCFSVLTNITVEVPGIYAFTKMEDSDETDWL